MQRQSIQDILGLGQNALAQQPFAYGQRSASPGAFIPMATGAIRGFTGGAGGM